MLKEFQLIETVGLISQIELKRLIIMISIHKRLLWKTKSFSVDGVFMWIRQNKCLCWCKGRYKHTFQDSIKMLHQIFLTFNFCLAPCCENEFREKNHDLSMKKYSYLTYLKRFHSHEKINLRVFLREFLLKCKFSD